MFHEIIKFLIFYREIIKKIFNKKRFKYLSERLKGIYNKIIKRFIKNPKRIFKGIFLTLGIILLIFLIYNLLKYIIKSGISVIGIFFLIFIMILLIFMTILTIKYQKNKSLKQIKETEKTFAHKVVFFIFVAYITTIIILFKRGLLDRKFTLYFIVTGSIVVLILMVLFTRSYSLYKPERLKKKRKFKLMNIEFKRGRYTTDIDILYNLIKINECIPLSYAAKSIKVDKKVIEEWAKILENHDLIVINYPAWGEPELCKK
ncbi:hypothetical protein HYX17_04690 [Candidatus Woesearchaeota archaeon]|nr:hypothetical protein [Candidatus Woesearchaeota archaeon]